MLPPTDYTEHACTGATAGMLFWDGQNPIACIPGFTADRRSGNVTVTGTALFNSGVTINNGLTVKSGPVQFSATSPVTILTLSAQCPDGGNVVSTPTGLLTCCPAGQIATSFDKYNEPVCSTVALVTTAPSPAPAPPPTSPAPAPVSSGGLITSLCGNPEDYAPGGNGYGPNNQPSMDLCANAGGMTSNGQLYWGVPSTPIWSNWDNAWNYTCSAPPGSTGYPLVVNCSAP